MWVGSAKGQVFYQQEKDFLLQNKYKWQYSWKGLSLWDTNSEMSMPVRRELAGQCLAQHRGLGLTSSLPFRGCGQLWASQSVWMKPLGATLNSLTPTGSLTWGEEPQSCLSPIRVVHCLTKIITQWHCFQDLNLRTTCAALHTASQKDLLPWCQHSASAI